MSRQAEVASALQAARTFVSAQELHAQLRKSPRPVGLTTVYRSLQKMANDGRADAVQGADGEVRYRACAADAHHHHLVCRSCNQATEIEAPDVERWAAAVAQDHDFADVAHTIELFGVCPRCRTAAGSTG
ncbi:MAG TPA: Fur family transcriptional regulator [Actinomycetes bacterium]|nr:Fur family transcriptional regulator [Actinomycetes bacterium]